MNTYGELSQEELASISDALMKAYPTAAIKERVGGGGKKLSYVEGHTAIRRTIEATRNRYDFVIKDVKILPFGQTSKGEEQSCVIVHGCLRIPGLSEEGRDNLGVQVMTNKSGEDLFKGAVTDCFKRCLMSYGNALELYGEDYESPSASDDTKKLFSTKYKAATGAALTVGAANKLARERFNKEFNDLKERELLELIKTVEVQEPKPF